MSRSGLGELGSGDAAAGKSRRPSSIFPPHSQNVLNDGSISKIQSPKRYDYKGQPIDTNACYITVSGEATNPTLPHSGFTLNIFTGYGGYNTYCYTARRASSDPFAILTWILASHLASQRATPSLAEDRSIEMLFSLEQACSSSEAPSSPYSSRPLNKFQAMSNHEYQTVPYCIVCQK